MNELLQKAIAEAYASAPVEVQMLHTLELNHKSFTQPARVARWPLEPEPRRFMLRLEDDAAYDPGALAEFIGLPFDISLPEKSENTPGEVNLRICGVGDYFDEDLEAMHLNARIGQRLRDGIVKFACDRRAFLQHCKTPVVRLPRASFNAAAECLSQRLTKAHLPVLRLDVKERLKYSKRWIGS